MIIAYPFLVYAHVLIPTHVHLLIEVQETPLSIIIRMGSDNGDSVPSEGSHELAGESPARVKGRKPCSLDGRRWMKKASIDPKPLLSYCLLTCT